MTIKDGIKLSIGLAIGKGISKVLDSALSLLVCENIVRFGLGKENELYELAKQVLESRYPMAYKRFVDEGIL